MKRLMLIAAIPLLLSACQSSGGSLGQIPTYGDVSDITDLRGVPAGEAEAALGNRGYRRVINSVPVSIWWNASTNTCASITMTGGAVTYVESAPATDCSR